MGEPKETTVSETGPTQETAPKESEIPATTLQPAAQNEDVKAVEQAQQDEEDYPSSWKLVLVLVALCLCVFCVALVWHISVNCSFDWTVY